MKPLLSTLTFYFTVFFCFSQTQDEKKTAFLEDLQIYREIVETSHLGMCLYTTKTVFNLMFKDVKQNLKEQNEYPLQPQINKHEP
ncbi:hypothetical protein N8009_00240 [Flavobacteriaceae bacterium]|nr:hypothetical protein [Flavobacteriaceae bacterium]